MVSIPQAFGPFNYSTNNQTQLFAAGAAFQPVDKKGRIISILPFREIGCRTGSASGNPRAYRDLLPPRKVLPFLAATFPPLAFKAC
jgi:hypothetical protein